MDFFLGIILGVTGFTIFNKLSKYHEEAQKLKQGRPPKKVVVKDENGAS